MSKIRTNGSGLYAFLINDVSSPMSYSEGGKTFNVYDIMIYDNGIIDWEMGIEEKFENMGEEKLKWEDIPEPIQNHVSKTLDNQ